MRKNFRGLSCGKERGDKILTRKSSNALRAALEAAAQANNPEGKWERLKDAVLSATKELHETTRIPYRKRWEPSTRTRNLLDIRETSRSSIAEEERKEVARSVCHSCRKDYRKHVDDLVSRMEKADSVGNHSGISRFSVSSQRGGLGRDTPIPRKLQTALR